MCKAFKVPFQIQNYTFTDVIGDGAFSIIYKARKGNDVFAIKQIPVSMIKADDLFIQLQREVDSLAYMKHENIVQLFDFFNDTRYFYMVCEFCGFGDLFEAIFTQKIRNEKLIPKFFYQIVSAIDYCHSRGVAHRDLKTSNILFDKPDHVKVCDFGLCAFF